MAPVLPHHRTYSPIGIRVWVEAWLPPRLQHHLRHRPRNSVGNHGNAERSRAAVCLGISTSRTGGGKFEHDDIRFQIL